MRRLLLSCAFVALWPCIAFTASPGSRIVEGMSRDEVIAVLGDPSGRMAVGASTVLYYDEVKVRLEGDKVTKVEPHASDARRKSRQTLNVSSVPASQPAPAAGGGPSPVVKHSNGGRRIDLRGLLVPGKVTVVDFYADWCGPCRRIDPHLRRLALSDSEVFLRKVDIVRWRTDVTRQFGIKSVPHVRVYDGAGRMVGAPTSDIRRIRQYVEHAR